MDTYFFGFSLLFFSGVFGIFIGPMPQNEAIMNGATGVKFNCTSSPHGATAIGWSFLPVGDSTKQQISNSLTLYISSFELEQPTGTLQNNLIIKVANESMAGTYICTEGTNTLSAELIVVISNLDCSLNASEELFQFQTVEMSCSITYITHSSLVTANMQWSDGSSEISSSITYTPSGYQTIATSTIYQQTGYSTPFPVHYCTSTFSISGNLPNGSAENQPSYSSISSLFSSPIPVNYLNPGSMNITGVNRDGSVVMGATVTCTIDANPPANYSWRYGSTTLNDSSIQIEKIGVYTCTAWNIAGSASQPINITRVLEPTAAPVESSLNASVGIIAGCVVGGVILLVLIAVLIYYFCFKKKGEPCCHCCKSKEKTESNYTQRDNRINFPAFERNNINLKPANKPPPYSGYVGPQREMEPDIVVRPNYYQSECSDTSYGNQRPVYHIHVSDESFSYPEVQMNNHPRSRQSLQSAETLI